MIINLPFFNELNSDSLNDYYEDKINLEHKKIQIDLNFEKTTIEPDKLLMLKDYLDNLLAIIDIAKEGIYNDFKNGEDVKDYLTFHKKALSKDELIDLLQDADKNLSIEQQILSILKLRRIGFYPYEDESFAVLDFILGEEISQYILVVTMTNNKTIDYITMES